LPETFAGARLDRAGEHRSDAAWVAQRLADPASRAVVVTRGGGVLTDPADETRLARFPLPVTGPTSDGDRSNQSGDADAVAVLAPVLLGLQDGAALFAVDGGRREDAVGLRDAIARLSGEEAALAGHASALLNWHRFHPHCSRCGHATDVGEAGYVRKCPNCGASHHPRTDPVVIMAVIDQANDRTLLGRQATWPAGRYSALAGFVEPGESLEEAVAREVREETGVEIDPEPRYVASQPWPFPTTLMLGFHAAYAGGEPHIGDGELEDVRWFTRDELREALSDRGEHRMPPPQAIAHRLIADWVEGSEG